MINLEQCVIYRVVLKTVIEKKLINFLICVLEYVVKVKESKFVSVLNYLSTMP
jgi:hypothetical protein